MKIMQKLLPRIRQKQVDELVEGDRFKLSGTKLTVIIQYVKVGREKTNVRGVLFDNDLQQEWFVEANLENSQKVRL